MNNIPVTILRQGEALSIAKQHILVQGGISIWTSMSQIEWGMIMDSPREIVREILDWYEQSELTPYSFRR